MSDDNDSGGSEAIHNGELGPEELYGITRKAKQSRHKKLPFDKHWERRNAKPDKRFVIDSNAFERSLFKYLAVQSEESVHAVVRRLAREEAMRRIVGGE
jgi:hypothetical protein